MYEFLMEWDGNNVSVINEKRINDLKKVIIVI